MMFSVITCTYNSAAYLAKNISSVEEQLCEDWEHIFVDAYSNDGTLEMINAYKKKHPNRVHIIQLPKSGISAAMNQGIRQASGKYVIHLHSDDNFVDNSVLQDVDVFFKKNPVDWIYGKILIQNKDGGIVGEFPNKFFHFSSADTIALLLLRLRNFIPHQSVFIKKEIFEHYGFFDESLSSSMDYDLWLRIARKTSWTFFDRRISNYMVRPDSQSASRARRTENERNFLHVQKRHLSSWQFLLARNIHFFLEMKNKNYR